MTAGLGQFRLHAMEVEFHTQQIADHDRKRDRLPEGPAGPPLSVTGGNSPVGDASACSGNGGCRSVGGMAAGEQVLARKLILTRRADGAGGEV
ncbi:hypothetical protein OOU_Y34scaffold00584g23 [Pyricularia oryzae Y34]|uniref:Uncharacterized protein n=2 Tax=Pyricularia oryzae TaxID=318829 RepID=A0AA97NWN7_PYRO3|nr:hypothetical protein OOU_Y34scaffold00584g23 [Pyricularia oryzae Y34]